MCADRDGQSVGISVIRDCQMVCLERERGREDRAWRQTGWRNRERERERVVYLS